MHKPLRYQCDPRNVRICRYLLTTVRGHESAPFALSSLMVVDAGPSYRDYRHTHSAPGAHRHLLPVRGRPTYAWRLRFNYLNAQVVAGGSNAVRRLFPSESPQHISIAIKTLQAIRAYDRIVLQMPRHNPSRIRLTMSWDLFALLSMGVRASPSRG